MYLNRNASTETAYFIFRGSESDRDWMADFNALQVDFDVKGTAQNQVFKNPEVQMGEWMVPMLIRVLPCASM